MPFKSLYGIKSYPGIYGPKPLYEEVDPENDTPFGIKIKCKKNMREKESKNENQKVNHVVAVGQGLSLRVSQNQPFLRLLLHR